MDIPPKLPATSFITSKNFLCTCLIVLFSVSFIHQVVKYRTESKFIDLAYFYFNSSMTRMGLDLFDSASVAKAEVQIPIRKAGGGPVYAPTMFVALAPLTVLSFNHFIILWLIAACIAVALSVVLIFKYEGRAGPVMVMAGCFIVAYCQPLHEALHIGQTDWLVLLLATGAWIGFKKKVPWLSGLCIAALTVAKLQYAALFAALLILRQYKTLGYALVFALVLQGAALPVLGIDHYKNWIHEFFKFGGSDTTTMFLGNIGINGMVHRMIPGNTTIAFVVYVGLVALVGLPVLWKLVRHKSSDSALGFLICLSMVPVVSPLAEIHHFMIYILPFIICIINIDKLELRPRVLFLTALVLIITRYSWNRFAYGSHIFLMPLLSLQVLGAYCLVWVLLALREKKAADPYPG